MLDVHNAEVKAGVNGLVVVHLSSGLNALENGVVGLRLHPGTRSFIRAFVRNQRSAEDFKGLDFKHRLG